MTKLKLQKLMNKMSDNELIIMDKFLKEIGDTSSSNEVSNRFRDWITNISNNYGINIDNYNKDRSNK